MEGCFRCHKIVSLTLLEELINNFVVCLHCGGTLLLGENVASSMHCGGTLLLGENVAIMHCGGTLLLGENVASRMHCGGTLLLDENVAIMHCGATLLLGENLASSPILEKTWNFTFEKKNCWFNRLKTRSVTTKRNCYFKTSHLC